MIDYPFLESAPTTAKHSKPSRDSFAYCDNSNRGKLVALPQICRFNGINKHAIVCICENFKENKKKPTKINIPDYERGVQLNVYHTGVKTWDFPVLPELESKIENKRYAANTAPPFLV